jgi:lactoylglutathione lyase
MTQDNPVSELRLAVTVADYAAALAFYRDALGLPVVGVWDGENGRGCALDAGRATLELLDETHAAFVDRVEVGRRVAGPIRVALRVADSAATAQALTGAGGTQLAPPAVTPWNDVNVRISAPDGLQLTLFSAG